MKFLYWCCIYPFFLFSMETPLLHHLFTTFDSIKKTDENGTEYRNARELQLLLGYTKRENFSAVIDKAKTSCKTAEIVLQEHFFLISGKTSIQWGRPKEDYNLSRYACYLIAQNWDPEKQEIAFAQAYFAVQTRKQELIEQKMLEMERLRARKKLTFTEKEFQELCYERGVDGDGIWRIRSKGDAVLFGGKTTQEMKKKLGVKSWPLADVLPTVTLKAKDLATEVTNHNMKHKALYGETPITDEHLRNTKGVRKYLTESWIKPEELPAEEDLKKIERKIAKEVKSLNQK